MTYFMKHWQVDGEQLLDLDMKKFRHEKQEVCILINR